MFFLHILGGASYAFGCAVYLLFSIILRHCHSYLCCNALIFKNSCAIILLKMLVDPLDFTLIKWHIAVCVSWLLHREPSLVSPAGSGTSGSDSPPDCHSIPSVSLRYSRMTRWWWLRAEWSFYGSTKPLPYRFVSHRYSLYTIPDHKFYILCIHYQYITLNRCNDMQNLCFVIFLDYSRHMLSRNTREDVGQNKIYDAHNIHTETDRIWANTLVQTDSEERRESH